MAAIPASFAILIVAAAIATASVDLPREEDSVIIANADVETLKDGLVSLLKEVKNDELGPLIKEVKDEIVKSLKDEILEGIDMEDMVPRVPRRAGGTNYVRWGVSTCPPTTKLVYAGVAAGPHYTNGGGADYLCLHKQPEFLETVAGLQFYRGRLYGSEYETYAQSPAFVDQVNDNVPCAVCSTRARGETLMIPGKTTCEKSWTREYYGYLMSEHYSHSRSTYVCMDVNAESIPGSSANTDGELFYFQEVVCNGINCPPYKEGDEVTCVVCTR